MTEPTRSPQPAAASDQPDVHREPQPRVLVVVTWTTAALGAYNTGIALLDGAWVRAAVWAVLLAVLLAAQVVRRRIGTCVEPGGLRAGGPRGWGPLVPWDDVVAVRVAGPYDTGSSAELRDGRVVVLRGMPVDAVREVVREHGLTAHDRGRVVHPSSPGAPAGVDPSVAPAADDAMDGPFRSAPRRRTPPAG